MSDRLLKPGLWVWDAAALAPEWLGLLRGLQVLLPLWAGRTTGGLYHPELTVTGGVTPIALPDGVGLSINGNSSQEITFPRPDAFTSCAGFTIVTRCKWAGVNAMGRWDSPASSQEWFLREQTGIQLFARNGADTAEASCNFTGQVGEDYRTYVLRGSGSQISILTSDGFSGSATLAGPYFPAGGTNTWSLGRPRASQNSTPLDVSIFAAWDRFLSDEEVGPVLRDPFGLIRLDDIAPWAPAGGGGGATIPLLLKTFQGGFANA